MFRKRCIEHGHKWDVTIGIPYAFCKRFRCSASAVSIYVPPIMAVELHNAIPPEDRVPSVTMRRENDGSITEIPLEEAR